MKIYVVGTALHYANFITDCELTDNLSEANIVIFTGGEDVDPSLYNSKKHPSTFSNIKRDLAEKEIFEQIREDQLCVGICRGSQFLCVMNGGKLVQNCINHALHETHSIKSNDKEFQITSTHHQMQYPYNLDNKDYTLLYTSLRSHFYEGYDIDGHLIMTLGEPEIVLYHKKGLPKCLAIQGHPEMIPDSSVSKMLDELIKSIYNENK